MGKLENTLFLPIEIIARELDSKLLIAHSYLDKGHAVIVGTKGSVYKTARSQGSGIYFYKDHSPLSSHMLQELHVASPNVPMTTCTGNRICVANNL